MALHQIGDLKDKRTDIEETRKVIENAENRARLVQRKGDCKVSRRSDREFARALHREADQIYQNGDYETALVLYHRAANVFPRDSSHNVAARRTAATISSWNNPTKALGKLLPNAPSETQLKVSPCPELAAIRATELLQTFPDPSSVPQVLRYMNNHKEFWKSKPSSVSSESRLKRSKTAPKQLNNIADKCLKNMEDSFNSGKIVESIKFAEELLRLSSGLRDPCRYQIASYHYLSLIQVSLGRHDRAVKLVSRMVQLSKKTGDAVLFSRSLVTLGKVHLSFGHLTAAARAWENLSADVEQPIPYAWIQHEIGRCHLEIGNYREAVEMASRCIKVAERANSKKWLLYGKLLLGQGLVKLGRFAEALEELKISAKITEEEGDTPMLSYIRDLIGQVTRALRRITFNEESGYWNIEQAEESRLPFLALTESARKQYPIYTPRENTLITTVFSEDRRIMECHNGSSSTEELVDPEEEITIPLEKGLKQLSYTERRARSDPAMREEENEEIIFPGNSTFRIRSPTRSLQRDNTPRVPYSLSDLGDDNDRARKNIIEKEYRDPVDQALIDMSKISDIGYEDEKLTFLKSSTTSVTSDDTYLTYVIEHSENDTKKATLFDIKHSTSTWEIQTLFNQSHRKIPFRGQSNIPNVRNYEDSDGLLNTLRVIEQLDEKDDGELLQMIRDMLTSKEDRSPDEILRTNDFRSTTSIKDKGPKFRTSRSSEDGHIGVEKHSLYRHSLPPSPRKPDTALVAYTCEGRKETLDTS